MTPVLAVGRWRLVCRLVANGFAQAWAAVGLALIVERSFAEITATERSGPVLVVGLTVGFAVVIALSSWLRARERVDAERLGQGYIHAVRLHLFDHLTAMSPREVGDRSTGATSLRFVGDLSAIRRWVSLGLARLAVALTMISATLAALWVIEPAIALLTLVSTAVAAAGALVIGPGLREADREARRRRAGLAGRITEAVTAVGVIQANGAVGRERKRVARRSQGLQSAMVDRARHLGLLAALAEGSGAAATAALLVGALLVGIDGPSVAAGMTVLAMLVPHLRGLTRVQEYRQGARVAGAAIDRFLARPTRVAVTVEPQPLPPGPGRLQLLDLAYGDTLTGVTVTTEPGATIAVVGPNGAGKSTLFSLIAGLLDPERGQIRLDGVAPTALAGPDLRRAIGVAGPDFPLLRGSIRRNLTYRVPDASEAEVAELLERCHLTELVVGLPDGLRHRVVEGGSNLSAGQRQRLLLARAMLGDPRLLLLDEADANLDRRTSRVVEDIVSRRVGTTLLITHDPSRLEWVDEIWHLDRGGLVERGRPDQLLDGDGPTARLLRSPVGAVS